MENLLIFQKQFYFASFKTRKKRIKKERSGEEKK